MRRLAALVALLAALVPLRASAVQLEELDLSHDWRLRALRFRGPAVLRRAELRRVMVTKTRPWFAVWRAPPLFDPMAFRTDLDRIRQLYRSRGYYHARVTYDLELPEVGDALIATIFIEEGKPVTIAAIDVTLAGAELPPNERILLLDHLPVVRGRVFTEEAYGRADTYLRAYYREHGFARVEVTKQATVDLARDEVQEGDRLESGPPRAVGPARVSGSEGGAPEGAGRELGY